MMSSPNSRYYRRQPLGVSSLGQLGGWEGAEQRSIANAGASSWPLRSPKRTEKVEIRYTCTSNRPSQSVVVVVASDACRRRREQAISLVGTLVV